MNTSAGWVHQRLREKLKETPSKSDSGINKSPKMSISPAKFPDNVIIASMYLKKVKNKEIK